MNSIPTYFDAENETEASFFNRKQYEEFKANPEVRLNFSLVSAF